jgi:hypothetical protein
MMRVIYTFQESEPQQGELQQWVYHPDVGVKAVVMRPDGTFLAVGITEVRKDDKQ